MKKTTAYKLADSVLHRIVQILQESMLVGVDIADLMRQLSLRPDSDDPHVLVLTDEYIEQVKAWHNKLLADAEKLQVSTTSEKNESKLIIS